MGASIANIRCYIEAPIQSRQMNYGLPAHIEAKSIPDLSA
jgi:hypothetical protein